MVDAIDERSVVLFIPETGDSLLIPMLFRREMEDLDDEDEMAWEMAQANRANPTIDSGPSQSNNVSEYYSGVGHHDAEHVILLVIPAVQGCTYSSIETPTDRHLRVGSITSILCFLESIKGYQAKPDRVGGSGTRRV